MKRRGLAAWGALLPLALIVCVGYIGTVLWTLRTSVSSSRTFPKDEKARFIDSVTNGKRQMPAWRGIVKPETMESIWLYIGSVNGW